MFPGHHRKIRILFGTADLVLIALAFLLAYQIRASLNLENDFYLDRPVAVALLIWSMLVWVGAASWWEIYDNIDAAHPRTILRDVFRQCLVGLVALVLFEFVWRLDLSRSFVAIFVLMTWTLMCLFRLNAPRLLGHFRKEFAESHYLMVVGLGEGARRIGAQYRQTAGQGAHLVGFVADHPTDVHPEEIELDGASFPVYSLHALPKLLRDHVIDEIVFATDSRTLSDLEEVLLMCDEEGVRTHISVDFFPHVHSRVYLERMGPSPLLTFSSLPHDEIRLLLKRGTDIVLATAALVLLAPVMLAIAFLIRITSPGPVIFRQERCGLNGRRFTFYKFRSMCQDAEKQQESLRHLSTRELALKIPNDPRLTPVGRWLRKFSIDEWPQLWNVLKGDMSLVGPRPAIPQEVAQYKAWQRRRLRMRPGLTCLWVVRGRDKVDFETWMRLDMEYIDNWSLGLDWKIILRTIPSVLSGRGAY